MFSTYYYSQRQHRGSILQYGGQIKRQYCGPHTNSGELFLSIVKFLILPLFRASIFQVKRTEFGIVLTEIGFYGISDIQINF